MVSHVCKRIAAWDTQQSHNPRVDLCVMLVYRRFYRQIDGKG